MFVAACEFETLDTLDSINRFFLFSFVPLYCLDSNDVPTNALECPYCKFALDYQIYQK